jgi:hypothetical protein
MKTGKNMGRNSLVKRLTAQTGSAGMATALLKKRGQMDASGALTPKGKARDNMTAAERAKDRAAKTTGRKAIDFSFNAKSNAARIKK